MISIESMWFVRGILKLTIRFRTSKLYNLIVFEFTFSYKVFFGLDFLTLLGYYFEFVNSCFIYLLFITFLHASDTLTGVKLP